jgi:predicted O-methyltransferase YrrM
MDRNPLAVRVKRAELALRKGMPSGIRRLLRLGKLALTSRPSSAPLPANLVADCRVCASRLDLLDRLPRQARVAEVGTLRGEFARHILDRCDPTELHLVDLEFEALDPTVAADARVRRHNGLSHEVLAGFPDGYFDWIYIDADHSYGGVKRDAWAAAAKVRSGGHLVFNDFAHMDSALGAYGVHRAVVEFATANGWKFTWLAYHPDALYDVALQRPREDADQPAVSVSAGSVAP